jgi:hypothetical protein
LPPPSGSWQTVASRSGAAVAIVLTVTAISCVLGILGMRRGHSYYREARGLKTRLERALGLSELGFALVSTSGMAEDHDPHKRSLVQFGVIRRWSVRVTTYLELLLLVIAVTCAVAVALLLRL